MGLQFVVTLIVSFMDDVTYVRDAEVCIWIVVNETSVMQFSGCFIAP